MAESSFPWSGDTTGDCGSYSATAEAEWKWLFSMTDMSEEGPLLSDGSFDGNLECTGSSSPVTVASGRAQVRGRLYKSTANEQFTISTPSAATRNDLIILRAAYSAQTVRLAKLTGSEGGGDPSLTQVDGTTWEIALWRVTITTGGAITLTDLREYCHFRTKVSTAMMDAGALAASSTGRAIMADGYFAADAASRAKLADGFLTGAKLADGCLSADATGRAKMADDFIQANHFDDDVDASATNLAAARLYSRKAKRDWWREDDSAGSYDDEFDDGSLNGKWNLYGTYAAAGEEYDDHHSHYMGYFATDGAWMELEEGFTPGGDNWNITMCISFGIRNTGAYYHLAVHDSSKQEGVCIKVSWEGTSYDNEYQVTTLHQNSGTWVPIAPTYQQICPTRMYLAIRRVGTQYNYAFSHDGVSFRGVGESTKVLIAGKISIFTYMGSARNIMARGCVGIDWIRVNFDGFDKF